MRDEVLALFREVADLSPEVRARYFEEHNVDRDVRAEVESLLAYDAPSGSLGSPIEREAKQLVESSAFGPYRTIGVLGEGGMGIVYLAEQTEPVRRRVALKVIKHAPAGSLVARFESERQALALLDHPNIARLYDAGETADGRPWFAMEYVPGLPITDYCDNNQLGLRERLLLFQHVCRAVEHAHEKGIIHRDLKPSNILVAKIGGAAVAKVIDFGVAKAVNLRLTERTLFTEVGILIGTPEYMSPEQAGDAEVGSATDIYSLGVVLYELLVGATPFDSKALRRAGYNEIFRIIRETDPPRPTTRLHSLGDTAGEVARRRGGTPAALARMLRGDLEWITMKALEKEPARRYRSPGEFAADVERHLRHEPVKARAPSAGYRLRKFVRRRRLELIAAAAVLLTIATALAALLLKNQTPGPTTMTEDRIDSLAGPIFAPEQTDGHWVVFRDDAAGNLVLSDVARKKRQVVFKGQPEDHYWYPSRDFSMVAIQMRRQPGRPAVVVIVKMDGTNRELLRDDAQGNLFGDAASVANWSWDNRRLLFYRETKADHRLLLISVPTGDRRELVTWNSGTLENAAFSPDGRFVAYQVNSAPGEKEMKARIYVLPSQGGLPQLIYDERLQNGVLDSMALNLMDWTADGRYLAIASMRTGRRALHLLPIQDSHPAGEPVFIRDGHFSVGYTSKSGALIHRFVKSEGLWAMHVASLDPAGRPTGWRRLQKFGKNVTNPWPHWSPEGDQIVYVARDSDIGQTGIATVRVRNLVTDEDRELYRTTGYMDCVWASRQPRIFCTQWGNRSDVFSILPSSLQIEHLGSFPMPYVIVDRPSRDDRAIYAASLDAGFTWDFQARVSAMRWDMATHRSNPLAEWSADGEFAVRTWMHVPRVSPSERWLARIHDHRLEVRPVSGGVWKPLAANDAGPFAFTPDSRWVYYHAKDSAGKDALFRVALEGEPPERLGDFPAEPLRGTMEISPDGRKILAASFDYENGFDIWSLENFVPAQRQR